MKAIVPIPVEFFEPLKRAGETGIGYQVVSVELRDGRRFEQVATSEGCFIEVRGYEEIPFSTDEVVSVRVNHRRWNFRDRSDAKVRAVGA